jgi:hypothetical protein
MGNRSHALRWWHHGVLGANPLILAAELDSFLILRNRLSIFMSPLLVCHHLLQHSCKKLVAIPRVLKSPDGCGKLSPTYNTRRNSICWSKEEFSAYYAMSGSHQQNTVQTTLVELTFEQYI